MDKTISTIPLLEILTRYAAKHAVSFSGVESNAIVEAMQEYAESYHEAKLKNITDEDIEAWAESWSSNADSKTLFKGVFETFKKGIIEGAKAALNGEIEHIEPQNNVCRVHGCNNPVSDGEHICVQCDQRFHEPND